MGIDKEKINDITAPTEGEKNYPVDLLVFFPKSNLNAIRLNQNSLFSDLYIELKEKIDISFRKIIKIRLLKNELFSDIIKKKYKKIGIVQVFRRKKERILIDPVSIIEPIGYVKRNIIDIRSLEIIPSKKIYPDFYKLPLLPKQKIKKFYTTHKIVIKRGLSRGSLATIILSSVISTLILFGVGYKNYIESETAKGYQELYALKAIKNPKELISKSQKLKSRFVKIDFLFSPVNIILNNFLYSNNSIKLANNVIKGGRKVSEIAIIGGEIWKDFNDEKNKKSEGNLENLNSVGEVKFSEFYKKEFNNLIKTDIAIKKAIYYYAQIGNIGNKSLEEKLGTILEQMIKYEKYLSFLIKNKEMVLTLMGDKKPTRYFILNQNKDEIRASGGFPGSVMTIELYKGNILKYDKKDIYYYDWHLAPYKETPPEGLNIISPNHGLRDANYFPIFLDSVNKINFFYEKSGGGTIDTVIGINQGLVEELLQKYGPVHLDEIGMDIDYKNFSLIMSTLVENKFQKIISPKDILFKFSEKFEKKLFEKKDFTGYLDIFINNVIKGDIQIASRDSEIQKYLDTLNVFEKWRKDEGNWIYPIFTSISGNKSDRYISRDFTINSVKTTGCQISNDFNIKSKHNFNDTTKESILTIFDKLNIKEAEERTRLLAIEGAGENRQFVRILTPKGSTLNNTYGNNIGIDDSHKDYTVFKFYLNTEIGIPKNIRFNYYSTPKNCNTKAIFYKQPGLGNYSFITN